MKINQNLVQSLTWALLCQGTSSFLLNSPKITHVFMSVNNNNESTSGTDNKAMSFLKKIGKIGGAANKDFALAVGIDEGGGKSSASGSVRVSHIEKPIV